MGDFSFQIFKEHQQTIRSFKDVKQFEAKFQLPENTWENYLDAARKDSVFVTTVPDKIKADLLLIIKSNIARYQWRSTGFFQLMQPSDKTIQKAIETIQKQ